MGPKIDPCGTPNKFSAHGLKKIVYLNTLVPVAQIRVKQFQ